MRVGVVRQEGMSTGEAFDLRGGSPAAVKLFIVNHYYRSGLKGSHGAIAPADLLSAMTGWLRMKKVRRYSNA